MSNNDDIVYFPFPFVLGHLVRWGVQVNCVGKVRKIFPAVDSVPSSEGYCIETPRGDLIFMQHSFVSDATIQDFDIWDNEQKRFASILI